MKTHAFHTLKVKKIRNLTPDCVSIKFEMPAELKADYAYHSGQHLTLLSTINGEEVRRPYSLSSAPFEGCWEVAVKRVEKGIFSTFANNELKEGDVLEVMVPDGNFRLKDHGSKNTVVAFAAGSGITPILSMIKTTLQDERLSFVLFYGNRNTESIIYREELEALKNKYLERFSVHYILSKEKLGSPLFFGRIDGEKCKAFVEYFIDLDDISQFLLCGPGEMIFDVKDTLTSLGVNPKMVHFELFTTVDMKKETRIEDTEEGDTVPDEVSEVKIRIDGLITQHQVPFKGKPILEWAIDDGADIPFSCKGGVCSTCRAKLLKGDVSLDINYALEPEELEAGFILTCQAHPRSPYVEIDFDEK